MHIKKERDYNGWHFRLLSKDYTDLAWLVIGLAGLQLEIEFPSDWHEKRRGWLRLGLGFGRGAISFQWPCAGEDHNQCGGPRFGFQFYDDLLWIRWGKDKGTGRDN